MGNARVTEKELAAKALGSRVTLADVTQEIESALYFNAGQVAQESGVKPVHPSLHRLTICILTLRNGFTVIGENACADPANFDDGIGRRLAREKAVEKLWPLLGFRLRDRLASSR